MLSPDDYRAYASAARAAAAEYRVEAVTEKEPRKSYLLTQAEQRDEHADFYESRADITEDYQLRHALKQEAA
ncbi:hypothetical protein EVB56_028 [Rhizobium phage RHph_Y1_10]|nr:hypothetical protein EVB56_028 [Rhizobium phage RHph_Y1_10]